jgi:hypothetical protein
MGFLGLRCVGCRGAAAQNTWVYTSNTTNSTYFWSTIKKGFTDAEQYCRDRGARLAAWWVAASMQRSALIAAGH